MNEIDELLKDTTARLFGDLCTRKALEQAAQGHWPDDMWEAVECAGLTSAVDPESDGSRLLPLPTLAIIVRALGEFALPLPVAETLLAQRALVQAGLAVPSGPLTVAPPHGRAQLRRHDGRWLLSAELRRVPWGRHARAVVVEARHGDATALVRLDRAAPVSEGLSLADEPRDDFSITDHTLPDDAVALQTCARHGLAREGALLRSLQMTGAMVRILGLTVQYSMERVQFGRAIAKFQAVQQQVATMATHAAAAAAAAEAAVNAADERAAEFDIAAAKLRTGEAAGVCCKVAHQVHGAMGFTHEHALHTFTRRLMCWRDEFGSESQCADWIGEQVHRIGGAGLWSYVSTPQLHAAEAAVEGARHA